MKKINKINKQAHPYHLVDPSPWPILGSFGALAATSGAVMWFHSYSGGGFILTAGLIIIALVMTFWWRDIIRESSFEGNHTSEVEAGVRKGMLLFIVSEILFFSAFFWGFFYSSISPDPSVGAVWPPADVTIFDAWEMPFLNTLILLNSACAITISHESLFAGRRGMAIGALGYTIFNAVVFMAFQLYEYLHASFDITDSVYGAAFFMATGFHGFHVFVGTCFLIVCFYRMVTHQFSQVHFSGFDTAAWYWHFVDVVWLFLFLAVYWWGGN